MNYQVRGQISKYGSSFSIQLPPRHLAILEASPFFDKKLHGARGLYLNRINVPDSHRGQGIGSALMRKFKHAAKEAGYRYIVVEPGGYQADDQNRRIRWYEKHGFVKQKEGHYLLKLKEEPP